MRSETAASTLLLSTVSVSSNNTISSLCTPETFLPLLSPNTTLLSAVPLPANSTYGEGSHNLPYPTNPTNLPPLCALTLNVSSSTTSSFRVGLFLPDRWSERILTVGNGGFGGGINWLDMGAAVRYGHAVVSTDTGHNSTMGDNTWALGNEETRKDFGWRAIHGAVELGKTLTEGYYQKEIKYSYYSGASTGGRQGLREAQLDPSSFDGMVIGAPAWWTSHMQPWTSKVAINNLPVGVENHVPVEMFGLIQQEVITQCDKLDGVVDGIVTWPDRCQFDVNALACAEDAADKSACLTPAQIDTVKSFYAPYVADGKFAFPGLGLSSEPQWPFLLSGDAPSSYGDGYVQNFLLNDPNWSWTEWQDDIVWKADAEDPGDCDADQYAAMAAFRDRGGKIFMYHGLSDGLIPVGSSQVFYEKVAEVLGGVDNLLPWFRYFEVPGMGHVTGTAVDAPWYFAGANAAGALGTDVYSTPGFENARHDALLALMDWVENGKPIEEIVATTWKTSSVVDSGVLRQRPLCPWPKRQEYVGGDETKVESFDCR
ncbi:hypothetical protein DL546_000342 [Coniochaeta pulveracea]|uniref:Carboxylic ester hydrolase n=1 Tax=Coniochaeta pulveracea TaxID=177199 RepID=A0A420Y014_9PEZI|nr:hypothetical protein DL546_000342 [Coniochaeta pulveracea]